MAGTRVDMRLIDLYEAPSANFDFEQFKIDCAPYLKVLEGAGSLPFHGSYTTPKDFEIRTFKDRMQPRDTALEVHKAVNEIFQEKYGHKFRNWLFMTSSLNDARAYGPVSIVFPIGEFNYAWSPFISDLTSSRVDVGDEIAKEQPGLDYQERAKLANERFIEKIKSTKYYLNENFKDAIESGHEINLSCKRFYMFSWLADTFHDIVYPYLKRNVL